MRILEEVNSWDYDTTRSDEGFEAHQSAVRDFEKKYGEKPRSIMDIMKNLTEEERRILVTKFSATDEEKAVPWKEAEKMDGFRSNIRLELGIEM